MNKLKNLTMDRLDDIFNIIIDSKKLIDNYDFENVETKFHEMTQQLGKVIDDFNSNNRTIVIKVLYDVNEHIINYSFKENVFNVNVKSCNNVTYHFNRTYTFPVRYTNCKVIRKYDELNKEMVFTFQPYCVDDLIETINKTSQEISDNETNECCHENKKHCENKKESNDFLKYKKIYDDYLSHMEQHQPVGKKTEPFSLSETDNINEKIWQMFTDGMSYRAIGREVGLSDKTVAKRVKKMLS